MICSRSEEMEANRYWPALISSCESVEVKSCFAGRSDAQFPFGTIDVVLDRARGDT